MTSDKHLRTASIPSDSSCPSQFRGELNLVVEDAGPAVDDLVIMRAFSRLAEIRRRSGLSPRCCPSIDGERPALGLLDGDQVVCRVPMTGEVLDDLDELERTWHALVVQRAAVES